jgi:hypothetical protein
METFYQQILYQDSSFLGKFLISIAGGIIGAGGAIIAFFLKKHHDDKIIERTRIADLNLKLKYFNSLVKTILSSSKLPPPEVVALRKTTL